MWRGRLIDDEILNWFDQTSKKKKKLQIIKIVERLDSLNPDLGPMGSSSQLLAPLENALSELNQEYSVTGDVLRSQKIISRKKTTIYFIFNS